MLGTASATWFDCQDSSEEEDQAMRVIGRSQSGQIVGCFERFNPQSGDLLAQRLDAYLRPVEQTCLQGFRETVAWLYAIGAVQFECIG